VILLVQSTLNFQSGFEHNKRKQLGIQQKKEIKEGGKTDKKDGEKTK
jgi:hypothetical protein